MLELSVYLCIGAASGLLAGLFGVGGGVILVPALILMFTHLGMAAEWIPHLAVGSSLAAIIGTGLASTAAHQRRGAVRWDLAARLAPGLVIGAWIGAALAGVLPEVWLTRLFALFLMVVGFRLLRPASTAPTRPLPGSAGLLTAGAGIGAVSALVGIGGGTLSVPFLSNRGLDLRKAVATSAACGVPIALAGSLGFIAVGWGREGLPQGATGFVYWPAVGAILLASLPTAPWGARLAHQLPVTLLRRLFGVLLVLIALRLVW